MRKRKPVIVIYDPAYENVFVKTQYGNYRDAASVDVGVSFDTLYVEKGKSALRRYAMANAMGYSEQVVGHLVGR